MLTGVIGECLIVLEMDKAKGRAYMERAGNAGEEWIERARYINGIY